MRSRVAPVLVFLACFAAVAISIGIAGRLLLPEPPVGELTYKFDDLVANARDATTVAVGSSRVLAEFDAPTYNATARALGCDEFAYNLGIAGLNLIEMNYVLRRLRALDLPRVRRVVVELPILIQFERGNFKSRRARLTTDPTEIGTALADFVSQPDERWLSALLRYIPVSLYHNSAIGIVAALLHPAEPDAPADNRPTQLGYLALDPSGPPTVTRREMLADPAELRSRLAAARALIDSRADGTALWGQSLRMRIAARLIDSVRSYGYEPVLVVLPQSRAESIIDAHALQRSLKEREPTLLVINTVSADFPIDFMRADAWYDLGHVTRDVAQTISTQFAREMCRARRRG